MLLERGADLGQGRRLAVRLVLVLLEQIAHRLAQVGRLVVGAPTAHRLGARASSSATPADCGPADARSCAVALRERAAGQEGDGQGSSAGVERAQVLGEQATFSEVREVAAMAAATFAPAVASARW